MMKMHKLSPTIGLLILILMTHGHVTRAETTSTNGNLPVTINTYGSCASTDGTLEAQMVDLQTTVMALQNTVDKLTSSGGHLGARDCSDIYYAQNQHTSGVYELWPNGSLPFNAYCLFDNEGLWTVLQHRVSGLTDFNRCWAEYRNGFGMFGSNSNYWLGLEKMHALTQQRQYTLRIDITDWERTTQYAEYAIFHIGGEANQYPIFYTGYTGTAGDALGQYHVLTKFSTLDADNDLSTDHCADKHKGGWWYRDCDHANLNGRYLTDPSITAQIDEGIEWDTWRVKYSFMETRMRIKPTYNDQLN